MPATTAAAQQRSAACYSCARLLLLLGLLAVVIGSLGSNLAAPLALLVTQDQLGLLPSDGAVELVRPRSPPPTKPVAETPPPVDSPVTFAPDDVEEPASSALPQQPLSSAAGVTATTTHKPTLPPLPDISKSDLHDAGLGSVLYVYRVVAPLGVAVRTKPSPIGALQQTSSETLGKIVKSYQKGDLVVGTKLGKSFGSWLKLADYRWAPITKKEAADGGFVAVMRQLKRISIPARLADYWKEQDDCSGMEEAAHAKCEDANMVRRGVLDVLRRSKLADIPATHSQRVQDGSTADAEDDDDDDDAEGAQHDAHHKDESAPNVDASDAAGREDAAASDDAEDAPHPVAAPNDDGDGSNAATAAAEVELGDNGDFDVDPSLLAENGAPPPITAGSACANITTWARCTKQAECAWRQLPNREFCELDVDPAVNEAALPRELQQDPRFDFPGHDPAAPRKYFVFQPSGGWNNQRLLLENALIICRLLNRTCVAPPAAPHSNYYPSYNRLPAAAVTGMPRLLNFDKLSEVAPLFAVPQGMTFPAFVDKHILGQTAMSVKIIVKDVSRYRPGTVNKWGERDIIRLFGREDADVLFFANSTMWGTMEWKGSIAGWFEKRAVNHRSMPPDHMKRVARRIAEELWPYHAVHVRRGDKVGEANFRLVSHGPDWWAARMAEYNATTSKVFIATDEKRRSFFDVFKDAHGFSLVFWEDLPRQKLLRQYLAAFPRRMFMDVLGMIEQLLCAYADKFLGSGYSTFTTYILRLRKYRTTLAADTAFSKESLLGLPEHVRGVKSSCDPITSLTHSRPC